MQKIDGSPLIHLNVNGSAPIAPHDASHDAPHDGDDNRRQEDQFC